MTNNRTQIFPGIFGMKWHGTSMLRVCNFTPGVLSGYQFYILKGFSQAQGGISGAAPSLPPPPPLCFEPIPPPPWLKSRGKITDAQITRFKTDVCRFLVAMCDHMKEKKSSIYFFCKVLKMLVTCLHGRVFRNL